MINIKKLKPINSAPINVDFNNIDEEGGVRLITKGAIESINNLGIKLEGGQLVWVSDTELEYLGVVSRRRDCWVVITINTTRHELG